MKVKDLYEIEKIMQMTLQTDGMFTIYGVEEIEYIVPYSFDWKGKILLAVE